VARAAAVQQPVDTGRSRAQSPRRPAPPGPALDPLAALVPIVTANVLAWAVPGPNMLAVMSASVSRGWRAGMATAMGVALAVTVWAVLAMLGVALVFRHMPQAMLVIRGLGALWLVWLGVRALLSVRAGAGGSLARLPQSRGAAFGTGFVTCITNPKAALFFGSVLTAFVPPDADQGFLVLVAVVCSGMSVILQGTTATVFATRPARALFARAERGFTVLFGLVFTGLGLGVAVEVAQALLR
jgi:threonine/homoserine/homoserine lactone efflux protein